MHEHKECEHKSLKHCQRCDVAYCDKCKKEWYKNVSSWTTTTTEPYKFYCSTVDGTVHTCQT